MDIPHVLVLPHLGQGHVIPLMEVAMRLAEHGIKVTFVNGEYVHKKLVDAKSKMDNGHKLMQLVAIPDGLEQLQEIDIGSGLKSILEVMPGKLENLILKINSSPHEKITCILADATFGLWPVRLAEKFELKKALFFVPATALFAMLDQIPKLIADGIIGTEGELIKDQMVTVLSSLPPMRTKDFLWYKVGDLLSQKLVFSSMAECSESIKLADRVISSSSDDLESEAFSLIPKAKPIGPLLASNRLGEMVGHFWPEDTSCLKWLDQQKENTVIYAAFGSTAVLDNMQFQQVALGLELTNRPFLWVVRQDIVDNLDTAYLGGFKERVGERGIILSWVPQHRVLSHPAIACFLTHCGWNSILESIGNGVPFLCMPYFADHFLGKSYICDYWKVGLELEKDDNGLVRQAEIKKKVEQLLDDGIFKAKAVDLRDKMMSSVKEGGFSYENLIEFVAWVKD